MIMNFLLRWIVCYALIMFAMSTDNLFWVSSSAEYWRYKMLPLFKKSSIQMWIEKKPYYTKIGYLIKYRIWSVLTDWRDIIPGLMTSFILAIFTGLI